MTARRRVCIVQEYVPVYRAPLFTMMRRLAMEEECFDIEVIAGRPQGGQAARGDVSNFRVDAFLTQHELRIFGHRLTFRNARRLTRDADLVIIEQARRNLDAYADLILRPSKIALWGHGHDRVQHAGGLRRTSLELLTRRASWFFGYTPSSVDSVVRSGFRRASTTTLWNTVDTGALRSDLRTVTNDERSRFRSGAAGVALFVGSFDESKRLQFLMSAAEQVANKRPGFGLVLAGDGPQRSLIEAHAAHSEWLTVMPRVEARELAVALSSADALAMPGRVGLVAVDSLVSTTPIVTTRWPYHAPEADYLDSTNSVWSDDDVASYADALERAVFDSDLNAELRRGAQLSSEPFTVEGMARRFVAGIRGALEAQTYERGA